MASKSQGWCSPRWGWAGVLWGCGAGRGPGAGPGGTWWHSGLPGPGRPTFDLFSCFHPFCSWGPGVCAVGGGQGGGARPSALTSLSQLHPCSGGPPWRDAVHGDLPASPGAKRLLLPLASSAPSPRDPRPSDCLLSWCLAGHPETDNCDSAARDRQPHSLEGSARAGRG